MAIQSVTGPTVQNEEEHLSDDDIAYREAKERGMTDDEEIYFRAYGYDVSG